MDGKQSNYVKNETMPICSEFIFQKIDTYEEFSSICKQTTDRFVILLFWVSWHPPCDDFKDLFSMYSINYCLERKSKQNVDGVEKNTPGIFGKYLWCDAEKSSALFKECQKFETHIIVEELDESDAIFSPVSRKRDNSKQLASGSFEIKGVPSFILFDFCKFLF